MDNSRIDWGYDTRDQLVSASRTNGPNGAADAAYDYSYSFDEVGNRTNEVRGQTVLDGTFNALNQIRTLNWSGMLDVLGQIGTTNNNPFTVLVNASTATVYNVTNFLGGTTLSAGSNSISIVTKDTVPTTNETVKTVFAPPTQPQVFRWDKNGCMTSDGYRDYTWNEECRLKEIETSSAAVTMGLPKRKSVFVYDGLGRRCKRTDYSGWNGSDYGSTNVTKYVWDGFNILAELNEDNSIKSYMVWGLDVSQSLQGAGGVGGLLAMTMGSTNYLYTYCGNGNVTDVLDDQGTVVAHYERDPFGRVVSQSGDFASENPWGFSTKMFDSWWGIVEFELRPTYSPELGRFLSKDPLEEFGSLNAYCFVQNSPLGYVEILGLKKASGIAYHLITSMSFARDRYIDQIECKKWDSHMTAALWKIDGLFDAAGDAALDMITKALKVAIPAIGPYLAGGEIAGHILKGEDAIAAEKLAGEIIKHNIDLSVTDIDQIDIGDKSKDKLVDILVKQSIENMKQQQIGPFLESKESLEEVWGYTQWARCTIKYTYNLQNTGQFNATCLYLKCNRLQERPNWAQRHLPFIGPGRYGPLGCCCAVKATASGQFMLEDWFGGKRSKSVTGGSWKVEPIGANRDVK